MKNIFQELTPHFLRKADNYLLLNSPHLWATRLHHLLFWAGLFNGLCWLSGWFFPFSLSRIPYDFGQIVFIILGNIITFLIWVYQMSKYGVEARFGMTNPKLQAADTFLMLIGIAFIFSGPLFFNKGIKMNIQTKITAEGLVNDINLLNTGQFIFLPHENNRDKYSTDGAKMLDCKLPYHHPATEKLLNETQILENIGNINTKEEERKILTTFLDLTEKYRGYDFDGRYAILKPEILFSQSTDSVRRSVLTSYYYGHEGSLDVRLLNPIDYSVTKNLEEIGEAWSPVVWGASDEKLSIYMFFVGMLGLLLMVFKRTNLRILVFSAIVGMLSVSLLGGIAQLIVVYGAYLALVLFTFLVRTSAKLIIPIKIGLVLLTLSTPLLPLNEDLLLLGIAFGYLAWFFLFNPRLMHLHSFPKSN